MSSKWLVPALPRPEIGKPDRIWERTGEDPDGRSTWYSRPRIVERLRIIMPKNLKDARRLVAKMTDSQKDELIKALQR